MEILTKIRAWAAALWKRERTESFVTERRAGSPEGRSRRTFWQVTAGTIALGSSAAVRAQTASCTLACKSTFEASVVDLPPLDFPVVWQRRHTASGPAGGSGGLAIYLQFTGRLKSPHDN